MDENDGNPQQPGGMAPPYGFMPNMQLMQQFFPPMQQNQMAGMPYNGPPAIPQMLHNFPMFHNPFHQMGGMQFNPMQAPTMDGQMQMMPPMFNQMHMMPPMGAQMPQPGSQMLPMGAQMPQPGAQMLPMGAQMPMMPQMGGPMMGGQFPFVQYVIVPVQMGPNPFPPNVPLPAPMPIKKEVKEEQDDSVIECTPPFIETPAQPRRKFSIANILEKDQIKKEPTGDEESTLANMTTINSIDRPTNTTHSPTIADVVPPPESIIPPRSSTPDVYPSPDYCRSPDCPASPDYCRSDHDSDDRNPMNIPSQTEMIEKTESPVVEQSQSRNLSSSTIEEIRQNHGGCDEYLSSADEGLIESAEELVSPPSSKWRNSFKEKAETDKLFPFDSHPPQERSMTVESLEKVLERRREIPIGKASIDMKTVARVGLVGTKEEKRGMREEEPKKKEEKQDFTSNEPPPYSPFCTTVTREGQERPSVPPRFPIRKRAKLPSESEDDTEKTSGSISPWRALSPLKGKDNPEDRRRLAACSILVKDVPRRFDEERIVRYFREKFGKCRLGRVHGQPSTVRIEFVSKKDRDLAFKRTKVQISKETMTIHEVEVEKEEGRKEDAVPPKESHAPLPPPPPPPPPPPLPRSYQQPQAQPAQPPITFTLVNYRGNCELGNKDIILTAGPIPRECSIRSFVEYARSLNGHVLDIPYPSPSMHRPHEYLIIRFHDFQQAKMVVAAQEHRVDGHVIPISPPYDVYLRLKGMVGLDATDVSNFVVHMLQEQCGIVVTIPTIKYKYDVVSFGYVSFARPQDARAAIKRFRFVGWGKEFEVCESSNNYSFNKYKEVWELKLRLEELSKKVMEDVAKRTASRESTTTSSASAATSSTTSSSLESTKRAKEMDEPIEKKRKKRNTVKRFSNSSKPMITVGPIPSHCLEECDEYLLSRFDDVYYIPNEMADRNFRILTVDDPVVISEMMKEGYLRVGKTGERVLISPPFDVVFKSANRGMIDVKQLVPYVQRRYGPVLRDGILKHGKLKLSFARYQDAQRAIDESPHFKSLQVEAEEAWPNISFAPFSNTDMQLLINRANEAYRMELAANIRVECHGEGSNKGKRNRSMEDVYGGEVLVCSPVKKKAKPEDELRVMVRVSDVEQWIPPKNVLLRHFQQFGQVDAFECENHLHAVIQYREIEQVRAAVNQNRVKLGGLWLDVIPVSQING